MLAFELDAGYCRTDNIWSADFARLEDVLDEEGSELLDAEAFSVNGYPADAAVWMGGSVGAVPWDLHRQAVEVSSAWREQAPPRPEDVRRLKQVKETWFVTQAPGSYYLVEDRPALGHLGLLVTEQHLVRAVHLHGDVLGVAELTDLIVMGGANPPQGLPAVRPRVVLVEDPVITEQLSQTLAARRLEVRVEAGDVSPAREALSALKEALDPDPVPGYFIHYPERDVKAFFKAAGGFFRRDPGRSSTATNSRPSGLVTAPGVTPT